MAKPGYVYIGEYFHKHGGIIPPEKKIGLTTNLTDRERALNSTKHTIGTLLTMAWEVDDMDVVEKGLHAILDHDRMSGEWFNDDDDTLKYRMIKYMSIYGYSRVDLDSSDESKTEKKVRQSLNKEYRDLKYLVGSKFKYKDIWIAVEAEDRYVEEESGLVGISLNKIIGEAHALKYGKTCSISIWGEMKNSKGQTPDEVCLLKHNA